MHGPGPYISLSKAGKLSGYTAEYLRQLCVSGKLSGQKIGKSWVIEASELHKIDPSLSLGPINTDESLNINLTTTPATSQDIALISSKIDLLIQPQKSFLALSMRQIVLVIGLMAALSVPIATNFFSLQDQITGLQTQYQAIKIQNTPQTTVALPPDESYVTNLVKVTVNRLLSSFQKKDSGLYPSSSLASGEIGQSGDGKSLPNGSGVVLGLNEDNQLIATITKILSDPLIQESLRGPQGPEGLAGPALQHIPNSGSVFGTTAPTAPQGSQGTIGSATYLSAKDFFAETLTVTGASSLADTNITGTLTLNGTGSFGGNLLPITDDTYNLGSTASRWQSLRIGTGTSSFAGPVGLGTTATLGNLDLRQLANGDTVIYAQRATDTGPTGNFLDFKTAAGSSLFSVDTAGNLVVGGTSTLNGLTITNSLLTSNAQATFTKVPTLAHVFDPSWPSGTSNGADGTIYINPASSVADGNLLSAAVGNTIKFLVDAEGDIYGG